MADLEIISSFKGNRARNVGAKLPVKGVQYRVAWRAGVIVGVGNPPYGEQFLF